MTISQLPSRRRAWATLAVAGTTLAASALLAAMLLGAGAVAFVPLLGAAALTGWAMSACLRVPTAVVVLRDERPDALTTGHLEALRHELAELPETAHPLGL